MFFGGQPSRNDIPANLSNGDKIARGTDGIAPKSVRFTYNSPLIIEPFRAKTAIEEYQQVTPNHQASVHSGVYMQMGKDAYDASKNFMAHTPLSE